MAEAKQPTIMPTILVVHAFGGCPKKFWYPTLQRRFASCATVCVPHLPGGAAPRIDAWMARLRALVADMTDQDVYLVGHSLGCNAILRLLAEPDAPTLLRRLRGVLCVAGWLRVDTPWPEMQPWCDNPPDLLAARRTLGALGAEITLMVSDDDRFTADHASNRAEWSAGLGARTLLCPGRAHFGGRKQPEVLHELEQLMGRHLSEGRGENDIGCGAAGPSSPELGPTTTTTSLALWGSVPHPSGASTGRRLLDCTTDELSEVMAQLLTDLTAGAACLGCLASCCRALRDACRRAQPPLIEAAAARLLLAADDDDDDGSRDHRSVLSTCTGDSTPSPLPLQPSLPSLPPLTLRQLGVLESVATLCIYPAELRYGPVAAVYFCKGDARLRPGSSLDRLDTFAAMLRRQNHANNGGDTARAAGATAHAPGAPLRVRVRVDAHAMGSRAQMREVSAARARAVVDELLSRGVPAGAFEAAVAWGDACVGAAGWAPGGYEARRAELFFVVDGLTVPPRPAYYATPGASEAAQELPLWADDDGGGGAAADNGLADDVKVD